MATENGVRSMVNSFFADKEKADRLFALSGNKTMSPADAAEAARKAEVESAIRSLHRAASVLSEFESGDGGQSARDSRLGARVSYNRACTICRSLGVDVHAELNGHGYTL